MSNKDEALEALPPTCMVKVMWRSRHDGSPLTFCGPDKEGHERWYEHRYSNGDTYTVAPDSTRGQGDKDERFVTHLYKRFGVAIGFNSEKVLVKGEDNRLYLMKPEWVLVVDR